MGVEIQFTVMVLMEFIRHRLPKGKADGFFIKVRNKIRKISDSIGDLAKSLAEEDGFLYIEVEKASMF